MDQEKTYKWIQDRIRDLHAGKLSAEDRMEMNELAKTDPFVRDAMEGYESNAAHDHSLLLKIISDRIQQKKSTRRTKIIPLSKGWLIPAIAASLVLILATWVVFYYVQRQGDNVFVSAEPNATSTIEHSTEVHLSDADSLDEIVSSGSGNDQGLVTESNASTTTAQPGGTGQLSRQTIVADARKQEAKGTKAKSEKDEHKEEIASDDANETETESSGPTLYPSPTSKLPVTPAERAYKESSDDKLMPEGAITTKSEPKDAGYSANQMNPVQMAQRIEGRVTRENGESLFGAIISVQNTNLLTTTDPDGKFELFLPSPSASVDVSLSGYRDTTITAYPQDESVSIILKENYLQPPSSLGYSVESVDQAMKSVSEKSVQPTADYLAFSEYIKKNSYYTVLDQYNPLAQVVTLKFTILKNKRPGSIHSTKASPDTKYTSEATRLLQNGPDWICDENIYPCEKTYTFYFKGKK